MSDEQDRGSSWRSKEGYVSSFNQSIERPTHQSSKVKPKVCLTHSRSLTHVCFSCRHETVCAGCLGQGTHKDHEVKTVERSAEVLATDLKESLIRLESKQEILQVLHEKMEGARADSFQDCQQYCETIAGQFDKLVEAIRCKEQQLKAEVVASQKRHEEELQRSMFLIRSNCDNYRHVLKLVADKVSRLSALELVDFYCDNKLAIDQLTADSEVVHLKKKLLHMGWSIDTAHLHLLVTGIHALELTKASHKPSLKSTPKRLSKANNSQTHKDVNRTLKDKKNCESTLLRKPSCNRITSMPTSPAKDDTFKKKPKRKP